MGDKTDEELVQQTRCGDTGTYDVLVTRYQGHVYGLACSFVGKWEGKCLRNSACD